MSKFQILILFAHPNQYKSKVNIPIVEALSSLGNTTIVDLYGEYPKFQIDIEKEQERLREHDVICFQFPIQWYSTPALLKQWQDDVLEFGFAYGDGEHALKGKKFLVSFTAAGPEEAYGQNGYNRFKINELLQPLEQTAVFCHMNYLEPTGLYDAHTAKESGALVEYIAKVKELFSSIS